MRWFLFILALAFAGPAYGQQTPPLFSSMGDGPIQSFTLKDQNGAAFSPEKLRGKVWLAHFFFTTCTEGCDKTVARMLAIQDAIRGKNDLALVSISVNPDIDTAELLAAYAADLKAEPGQWIFLTGSKNEVDDIVQKVFFQRSGFADSSAKGPKIEHYWNLLIIDREGNIVGYADGRDPTNVPPLLERVKALASERYTLPAVNATLNGTAGFLLVVGYFAIRRRKIGLHKTCMLSAFACSTVFLASYLYYHFAVLKGVPTTFAGPATVRYAYLGILLTHTILAIAVAPLAIYTTFQGLKNNLARHVKVARWTLPIWLYVSATGVVVYVMLYHLYPPY